MFKNFFIKTFVSAIIIASASFMIVSCQKEAVTLPNEQVETLALQQKSKTVIDGNDVSALASLCTPTSSTSGANLVAALTSKTCLAVNFTCTGIPTNTTVAISQILSINGNEFYFNNGSTITVTQQKALIAHAKVLANANTPAGYALTKIAYIKGSYEPKGTSSPASGLTVTATYSKCGPPQQG